jgi:hypothetical protein
MALFLQEDRQGAQLALCTARNEIIDQASNAHPSSFERIAKDGRRLPSARINLLPARLADA